MVMDRVPGLVPEHAFDVLRDLDDPESAVGFEATAQRLLTQPNVWDSFELSGEVRALTWDDEGKTLFAAARLDRPPILSYDGYALYNWKRFDPAGPIAVGRRRDGARAAVSAR